MDENKKYVTAQIAQNRQNLQEDNFWRLAVENEEVWLYDHAGKKNMDPSLLPSSFRCSL